MYVIVPLALREPAAAPFGALWLAVLGLNGYWFLVRLAYRVDLHEHAVRWWTPLRSGRIPLDRLHEIRPSQLGHSVVVFEVGGGPAVLVMATRRFVGCAEQVQAAAPRVNVRLNWYLRLVGRFGRNR